LRFNAANNFLSLQNPDFYSFFMKKQVFFVAISVLLAVGCTPKAGKKMSSPDPKPSNEPVTINLPELEILAGKDSLSDVFPNELPVYQAAARREHDLIHEKVELKFDWPKAHAIGKATLTLKPYFYKTDSLTLDAKNLDIKTVRFEGKNDDLKYRYNGEKMVIQLGKTFSRNDEYKIVISYISKPEERSSFGGSSAITSDKGLYFINYDGKDTEKPMQIWTQGETEANSRWMPTIDKPNERCTDEIILTVEDKYKTLSNGKMVSSTKNSDGTRTDYWKMDLPHAPYLFMFAVGEFAIVQDKWRDKDLFYYVEQKYEPHAKAIFAHTPEMLTFFSEKLGYNFPWQQYAQIVIRDYVSGAMENTGAVTFGEYAQQTTRELMDDEYNVEKTVAHEMFHHWFGDLVTCESWSNLTLNEGFANYSEYLWMETKHGKDAADQHLSGERDGYFGSAMDGGHDLIDFHYADRESMFDGHSYNKGGCVLHMLRKYLGDEAFFGALQAYLKKHEFTAVEADELRMAFEDFTGEDLNWFWNQWYFNKGWPTIAAQWEFDAATEKVRLDLAQIQDPTTMNPIFTLPTTVDIWQADGSKKSFPITFNQRSQSFEFSVKTRPALVDIDPERVLVATWNYEKTADELEFLYKNSLAFDARNEALSFFSGETNPKTAEIAKIAANDKTSNLRGWGAANLDLSDPTALAKLENMAKNDPTPSVRTMAIARLGELDGKKYFAFFGQLLGEKEPYSVVTACLSKMIETDPKLAAEAAKPLESDPNVSIQTTLMELYAATGDRTKMDFFKKQLNSVDGARAFAFFDTYPVFLKNTGEIAEKTAFLAQCYKFALDMTQSQWRRFGSAKAISDEKNALLEAGKKAEAAPYEKWISEIKAFEKDEMLMMYYQMF
jgi:aminopeptidase N